MDGEACVGVIIGRIDMHGVQKRGYIGMLAVEASYRKRGIGKAPFTSFVGWNPPLNGQRGARRQRRCTQGRRWCGGLSPSCSGLAATR